MTAVVVYESLWGNTAAVARAIAEGLGPGARALATDEATPDVLAGVDLLVAGAPVMGFSLPTEAMRRNVAMSEADAPTPPDLSHPSLRSWLDAIPLARERAFGVAFETRIWWSPRGATGAIRERLAQAAYDPIGKGEKFVVEGKYGPLRAGELERARAWGRELAAIVERLAVPVAG